ncbi:MAG: CoF synthetase [Hyphomonas sp.]|uniref:F390 synthetase-related protein n=1 Tax=Hyphomonas sp. TaxID=87 RepID=UPI001E1410F5|nr:F390 synthetase-related protein [Hyphomonas sp.]MBA4226066.1 CoF synthetase [Hyphomonas sp.]
MNPAAASFTLAAFIEARRRQMLYRTRESMLRAQERRLYAFLRRKAGRVPAFEGIRGRFLQDWPVMDKAALMADFARYNRLGLTAAEGWAHLEAGTAPKGYAIGASTGTSGNRGLYIVSERERYRWLGTILAHALPDFLCRRHRVAIVLPANSRLYDAANESGRLQLRFFDLGLGSEAQFAPLAEFQPTVIVAPPKFLRALAESDTQITPQRLFSGAEVLDEEDRRIIETRFDLIVREIYMATEGLFGIACRHGTLHLLEDQVAFEFLPVEGSASLVTPLITDFSRETQVMIRYQMNDVLEFAPIPCPCGRPHRAIQQVHGRCDDIFTLPSFGSPVRITPDVIRNAVLKADKRISDFRVIQTGRNTVRVELNAEEADCLPAAAASLRALFTACGAAPEIKPVATVLIPPSDRKLRRVRVDIA